MSSDMPAGTRHDGHGATQLLSRSSLSPVLLRVDLARAPPARLLRGKRAVLCHPVSFSFSRFLLFCSSNMLQPTCSECAAIPSLDNSSDTSLFIFPSDASEFRSIIARFVVGQSDCDARGQRHGSGIPKCVAATGALGWILLGRCDRRSGDRRDQRHARCRWAVAGWVIPLRPLPSK